MGLKTFINNIRYLSRYNIKKIANSQVNLEDIVKIIHLFPYIEMESVKKPNILGIEETIELLINTDKSIIRYGDGEFELMGGGI
ncbi:MAG: hypothetical protein K2N11_02360 [Mucispirillum sp.]|nr:hypothetical protein [Mucispirillum sp.]